MSSIKISPTSTLKRQQLVGATYRENGRARTSIVKAKHTSRSFHRACIRSQSLSLPSALFQGTSRHTAVLESASFSRLKRLTLQMTIANGNGSTAYTLVPACYLFEKIVLKGQNGSTDLATIYADQLALSFAAKSDAEQTVLAMTNSAGMFSGAGVVRQPAYSGDTLAASGSVVVQLPIDCSVFHNSELWYQNVGQDVHIELHPRNGVTTAASGTDVTVSASQFNIESEILSETDSQAQARFFASGLYTHRFLDVVKVSAIGATVSASTQYRLNLDSVSGACAFIHLVIKGSTVSNTSNGYFAWEDIGEGTIGLETPSQMELFGKGSPPSSNLVRYNEWIKHWGNSFAHTKPAYVISFCDNAKDCFDHAVMNGHLNLDGSKYSLVFTPSSTFTTGTYDVVAYCYCHASLKSDKGRLRTERLVPPGIKLSE